MTGPSGALGAVRRLFRAAGLAVLAAACWALLPGRAPAQWRRDSTAVIDQEFLRLIQQADQINAEQKQRARRTRNPRVLRRLGEDEDPGVRFHVGFNPHTPLDVLVALVGDSNPSVRWAVARNDRFLFSLDTTSVKGLDDQSAPEVAAAFGRHAIRLARDARVTVESAGAAWVVEDRHSRFRLRQRRKGLAVHSDMLPREALDGLAKDIIEVVRVGLADNPGAAPWILGRLSTDPSPTVRRHVAMNESTEPAVLDALSRDAERRVRLEVAGNPFTPVHVLDLFSIDGDAEIRRRVAANPGGSPAIMLGMAFDSDDTVRTEVAAHLATPGPGLAKLAQDGVAGVRQAVVQNANTTREALRQLSFDADPAIRTAARRRLSNILKEQIEVDRER